MLKQTISRATLRHIRPARFWVIVTTLTVTGITVSAWAWLSPAGKAGLIAPVTKGESTPGLDPAGSVSTQNRVEAETITLSPAGFEPSEIRRAAGRFLLAVDNVSELEEVVLRLDREGGQAIRKVRLPRRQQKWRQVFDLAPGTYTLTEANHPEWLCQITIE